MSDRKLGMRFFIFEPDGILKGLSQRSFNRLLNRRGAIPQFSGQRVRDAEVTVELENGKLVRIVKLHFGYWVLDAEGMLDVNDRLERMRASMDAKTYSLIPGRNVLSLDRIRKARKIIAASQWTPSDEQVAQVIGAILGECRAPGARKPPYLQIVEAPPSLD